MPILIIVSKWGLKHDPRTNTEELILKWLRFGEAALRKTSENLVTEMTFQAYHLSKWPEYW